MNKNFLCLFAVFLMFSLPAYSCKLPRGEKMTIGCAYKCGFLYSLRLRLAALAMGHKLRIVNMRTYASVQEAMTAVDAVLLPGGADINPRFYLDAVTAELALYTRENIGRVKFTEEGMHRDQFEYDLVKSYSSDEKFAKLPMLGICRGMQMMAVAEGIPLYLDIKTELGIKNRLHLFDRINVGAGESLMSSLYGEKRFKGYEQHHQGIRMSYYLEHRNDFPHAKVTATSNKELIAEALEFDHRPALGIQYHPEKSFSSASFPVYKWLLTQACEHKTSKDHQ